MANIKNQEFVKNFTEKIKSTSGVILTDYQGLKANEMNELRVSLFSVNSEIRIVKNTLASIVFSNMGHQNFTEKFSGPSALIIIDSASDPTAVAKKVIAFSKTHETLKIKNGFIQGKLLSSNDIKVLADLPSREVLLAQNVMMIKMPLSRLMSVVQSPISKLVTLLKRKAELDSKQG
jgi:large subunit ribosomal protein L10